MLNQKGNLSLILGILILIAVVGAGAYYLGTQKNTNYQSNTVGQPTPSPSIASSQPASDSAKPVTSASWKTFKAMPKGSLKGFTLQYPPDWEVNERKDPGGMSNIVVKKGSTSIVLYEEISDGNGCLYPEDKKIQGRYGWYGSYTQFEKGDVTWRLALPENDPTIGYILCEKSFNGKFFGPLTSIGGVTVILPTRDTPLSKEVKEIFEKIEITK